MPVILAYCRVKYSVIYYIIIIPWNFCDENDLVYSTVHKDELPHGDHPLMVGYSKGNNPSSILVYCTWHIFGFFFCRVCSPEPNNIGKIYLRGTHCQLYLASKRSLFYYLKEYLERT